MVRGQVEETLTKQREADNHWEDQIDVRVYSCDITFITFSNLFIMIL